MGKDFEPRPFNDGFRAFSRGAERKAPYKGIDKYKWEVGFDTASNYPQATEARKRNLVKYKHTSNNHHVGTHNNLRNVTKILDSFINNHKYKITTDEINNNDWLKDLLLVNYNLAMILEPEALKFIIEEAKKRG